MNYYRRYIGDYAADTAHLSLAEHGAYALLLDSYYSTERPLPASIDLLYRICRAHTSAEKAAVRKVAEEFFPIDESGESRRNPRADKEIGIAAPKIERMRAASKENGKKGGRPKKPSDNPACNPNETQQEPSEKPALKQPPSASLQPEALSDQRSQGRDIPAGEPPAPLSLNQARLDPDTPAAILASVLFANSIKATAFHPLVVEWARDGVTVDRVKAAIAKARVTKGDASIPVGYLDPILRDDSKPKIQGWRHDDFEARKLCDELGIGRDGSGELRDTWHRRIERALAERARAKVV